MMQQMRRNTKWIMILAALAFGGLMFFDWGMDITGQSAGSLGEIGRVNGTPVLYDDYMQAYRNLYGQLAQTQEEPVTGAQNSELEDQAWNEMVNNILIQQELDRRGIVVTDEEIVNAARFSPPAEVIDNPAYHTDGRFDITKYQQFISVADRRVLLGLEAYYRNVIPRAKLLRQVGSGIYVSANDLWNTYKADHEKASVRYVSFDPLIRVSDDEIEITADEISDYYDEDREQFFDPASAKVIAVSVAKTPTAADTAAVFARAGELRQAILDGEDFAEVALRESSDESTAAEGGDLGVFGRGAMVHTFDSAVFAGRLNRVTDPVRTSYGVHIIEVTRRWGRDSAQARHILLPFERTEDSEIELYTVADSLEVLGESIPLAEAAAILGLKADTVEFLETFPIAPGAGDVTEGAEWVFEPESQPGEVSPVFENRTAFYSMELIAVDPSRYLTREEAEPSIRASINTLRKVDVAMDEAQTVAEQVRAGRTLDEVAREMALEVRDAGPFSRNENVPGLGRFNAVIGSAFGLEIGEVSDAVQANQNAFVVELTALEAADSMAWLDQIDFQRAQLVRALQEQRLYQWIDGLREDAEIVDRREEVLNPPEEEDQVRLPPVF